MKFGNRKINNEEINVSKVTVLSLGFELTGDVISKNDIRADGILHGNIRTDKKVVVGEKASIVGDILAEEISISGEVTGDLYINGETTIYSSAKVSGKILTNQIFIHKGASLNTCIRTDSTENIQKEKESSQLQTVDPNNTFSPIQTREETKKEKLVLAMNSEESIKEKPREKETTDSEFIIGKKSHRSW